MSESNFSKADSSVYQEFLDLVEKVFPELSSFSFGLLFRNKIKKSRGNLILAEICLPSKLMSYFAKNEAGNPYDYLMIIDEMAWACAKPMERTRIVRHELRHVFVDEKGNPKLIDHDFADFHVEVELNKDCPMWASNLAEVVVAGYKQVKDGQKDPRTNRADAEDLKPVTHEPQRQTQIESAIKSGVKKGMASLKDKADKPRPKTEDTEVKPTGGINSLKDVYHDGHNSTSAPNSKGGVVARGTGKGLVPESNVKGTTDDDRGFVPNPTINNGRSLEDIAREKGLLGATA